MTRKNFVESAIAVAFVFGLAPAAYAVTGQFNDLCAEGLAMHKQIHTNCSVNAT